MPSLILQMPVNEEKPLESVSVILLLLNITNNKTILCIYFSYKLVFYTCSHVTIYIFMYLYIYSKVLILGPDSVHKSKSFFTITGSLAWCDMLYDHRDLIYISGRWKVPGSNGFCSLILMPFNTKWNSRLG